MKKVNKKSVRLTNNDFVSENDEIFDPDDNLYNTPDRDENLTFSVKNNYMSNIGTFSKKLKKDSNCEK